MNIPKLHIKVIDRFLRKEQYSSLWLVPIAVSDNSLLIYNIYELTINLNFSII